MEDSDLRNESHGEECKQDISICPVCGSNRRFFESIGEELKKRGLFKEDMMSYYELRAGPFGNREVAARLPIGGELPAYAIGTDICLGYPGKPCGCIYAVRIERTNAKKGLAPVQFQPNRAMRRHGGNGGEQGINLGNF